MASVIQSLVLGPSIAVSFILAGNAMTMTFVTVPALLLDFPDPKFHDFSTRADLLARQFIICWKAGNYFFRSIGSLAGLGYGFCTYHKYSRSTVATEWTPFAVATLMHIVISLHSLLIMVPLNKKLFSCVNESKDGDGSAAASQAGAEGFLRKWAKLNIVRIAAPLIAGLLAITHPF